MPTTTRHLVQDTLLLMLAATLVIVGANGLLLSWLALLYSPLHLLLVGDGFMAMLLGGVGLLAVLFGWQEAARLAGGFLAALLAITLGAELSLPGLGWGESAQRLSMLPALLLLPVALYLLLGEWGRSFDRVWLLWGVLLALLGCLALLPVLPDLRSWYQARFEPTLLAALVMVGLQGGGMAVAVVRGGRGLRLGRMALASGLAGILVSSVVWFVLSWQQEQSLNRQADYLLDNIQLNAEQVMVSRLTLMRRMADRLDASEGALDPEVLERDLQSYLQDAASLQGVGLYDPDMGWVWLAGRDRVSEERLARGVRLAPVSEWLGFELGQPRIMMPEAEGPGMALVAIDIPRHGQQLLSLFDLSNLLAHELRLQLGLYRVVVLRREARLLELQQPGFSPLVAEGIFVNHLLQRRHIGLPGGPALTLEVYPGTQHDWLISSLMPLGVASGGLLLSGMLTFSLALAAQLLGRSRALGEARRQLVAQQAVQNRIVHEDPLEQILEDICAMLEEQLPGSLASIMLVDDDGRRLRMVAGGRLPEGYRQVVASIEIGPEVGSCGSAAHSKRMVISEDIARDPRWRGFHQEAKAAGLAACWSIPVMGSDGSVLGTFGTYMREAGAPGEAAALLIGKAADLVALAVERHQSRRTLRLLERSVEGSINGVVITDAGKPDQPIIYVNPAFERITGYTPEEALGRNCRFLQGPSTDPESVALIRRQLAKEEEVHVTLCNYRKDGSPFWNDLYVSPVRDSQGRVTHYVGMQNDVSDQKAYESQLAHHASHDALTGLVNRSLFEDRLDHEVAHANRRGERLAVLFIDLDDFKPINDTLGHAVGDDVLREVARRLLASVRPGDTVARLGGDEFVLLMVDVTQEEQVLSLVERLMHQVARPYLVNQHELYLTCSIGISLSDPAMDDARQLIQQADMAMYQAKQQGRNAYHWYTSEITERLGERMALRNDLQEAIESQGLTLHYQPLIARDGSLAGVEALLRWDHPVRGPVSPEVFVPLAESTGQIVPLSRWVLERACGDMLSLEAKGLGGIRVAVNLSPLQFHRPSFLATLRDVLRNTGFPAERLELELTEGILMDNAEAAIDILHALRGMRVGVSIDDFGTGYSSLSYLRNLPIRKMKIDRSFITEVTSNPHDAAIVKGIISMAGHLGLEVVAEGVETDAQRQQLAAWGCDIFQGYLLARPMPLEALCGFLAGEVSSIRAPEE
jgi:diguanylate cyclase (GGDEF)-like protein/PAS domain S-box-containing protein